MLPELKRVYTRTLRCTSHIEIRYYRDHGAASSIGSLEN